MSRVERSYEKPSRGSRLLVLVALLAVIALAGWVLTPILAEKFPVQVAAVSAWKDTLLTTATGAARQPPTPVSEPLQRSTEVVMEPASPPTEQADAEDVADASPADEPQPMTLASIPDSAEKQALAPRPAPALPPGLLPWPTAAAAPEPPETTASTAPAMTEQAATEPASDDVGPVPLPRKKPAARTMAQLAVPLPRPRPTDAPAVDEEPALSPEEESLFRRQGHSD